MTRDQFYEKYGSRITQDSERLFIDEFLHPLLGEKIGDIEPQQPFIDSTGRCRRIDFAYKADRARLAFEVNGETYHAEGVIAGDVFDDNLFRQNEILRSGYRLIRFSYSQLQSPSWRPVIKQGLRDFVADNAPELLSAYSLPPNELQTAALDALDFFRNQRHWTRGVVILPTGTGKTVLSALDAKRHGGRVLFLVHRLDILKQSIDAYRLVWPDARIGVLTGEVREHERDCDVLFASKDTLRQPAELARFGRHWFDYIVVDEVHHGQSPTYREVIGYFLPSFALGMTATPDRTDRRDILELFDYHKVFEVPLSEAIERGFLVPYSYYGLTDNIDYTRIRYQNHKYNVADLERYLIVPERNEQIVAEYLERGHGDKAIGFCASILHAERMAEVFSANGIAAAAIHSGSPNRDQLLAAFRENRMQVAFTVDLFNEGVDFPNVRVLLFLRPTESKTVFMQQLGRGLRLCIGKDRVRVLDFIGNYQRANQIRKYLSKGSRVEEVEKNGRRGRKLVYEYSPGCEVVFDETVEEILDRQDAAELGIDKQDLKEAYFALAEQLGRKPTRGELDEQGEYKSAHYTRLFGSWVAFLREVGEYTEASYHYPQGVHLGHVLSIVKTFGQGNRAGTHFDDRFIRLRGELGEGRLSTYRRQVKYKLLAAMELGVLTDDRTYGPDEIYTVELTPLGRELFMALQPVLDRLDLRFPLGEEDIPTTRMAEDESVYNAQVRAFIDSNEDARRVFLKVFLGMHAVKQMAAFLFHIARSTTVARAEIYGQFFQAPFVRQYCEQEGIEETTLEASRRRCPFLLNVLDACGILTAERNSVVLNTLLVSPALVRPYAGEEAEQSAARVSAVVAALEAGAHARDIDLSQVISNEDLSIVRELFGAPFLTPAYPLKQWLAIKD